MYVCCSLTPSHISILVDESLSCAISWLAEDVHTYMHSSRSEQGWPPYIDTAALLRAGARDGKQWLVVAGWECSDLSPAGRGAGLRGERSNTFFALRRIVGAIQQLQQQKPPGYLLENTYLNYDFGAVSKVVAEDRELILHSVGYPVVCDAARFGSYAHRLRHFWTNLAASEHLQCCIEVAVRPPGLTVYDILLPGRSVLPVEHSDRKPFYPCNVTLGVREAFPTFVTIVNSRAFRPGGPGAVLDPTLRGHTEPCPDERELAMGFDQGCTRVPNYPRQPSVTEEHRHVLTGRAMDLNTVSSLFALCLRLAQPGSAVLPSVSAPPSVSVASTVARMHAQPVLVSDPVPSVSALPTHTVSAAYASTLHCMAVAECCPTGGSDRDGG
jgi:hypothetical protein